MGLVEPSLCSRFYGCRYLHTETNSHYLGTNLWGGFYPVRNLWSVDKIAKLDRMCAIWFSFLYRNQGCV